MTDNLDPGYDDQKVNVVFTRLDLEIPAVENPRGWVEAMRLMRLAHARSGVIAENVLRGGPIEFFDGPWQIVDNEFRGTPPGTFSHGFLTGHDVHDLLVRGNRLVRPAAQRQDLAVPGPDRLPARRIASSDNTIEGIGARDDDTIPWMNEPEIILTEAYSLRYEGKVCALSPDGKVLQIGGAPWDTDPDRRRRLDPVRTGRRASGDASSRPSIATTVLVDEPIPRGNGDRLDLAGVRRRAVSRGTGSTSAAASARTASCWPATISARGWSTTTCWAAAWPSG